MIPFTPVNGDAKSGLDSLVAPSQSNGNERTSHLQPPLETADNGNAQIDANERPLSPGPRLPNGDNGNAQIDANERRLHLRRPLETADNGNAQIDANERRLSPGLRLPIGDNGETREDRAPDHGYLTVITVKSGRIAPRSHGYLTVITVNQRGIRAPTAVTQRGLHS
jgi:hypothetical protein